MTAGRFAGLVAGDGSATLVVQLYKGCFLPVIIDNDVVSGSAAFACASLNSAAGCRSRMAFISAAIS